MLLYTQVLRAVSQIRIGRNYEAHTPLIASGMLACGGDNMLVGSGDGMNSPLTGNPMTLKTERQTLFYRGCAFEIDCQHYECPDTGERFTTTELDDAALQEVYRQYNAMENKQ